MGPDIDYIIAYANIWGYCVAVRVFSLRRLEKDLWPKMCSPILISRDVFRKAARDVFWAMSTITAEPCGTHTAEEDDAGPLADLDPGFPLPMFDTLPEERETDRARRRRRKAE
jgi:hypothetical protein